MTEENITKTVELVEKALREFDQETLKKYVNSKTLNYIITFAKDHSQFAEIGQALFENLTLEVKEVDTENETVTLLVTNKDMTEAAELYAKRLHYQFKTTPELIGGLSDEYFLDSSVKMLTSLISRAIVPDNPTEITIEVNKSSKNLVLVFDEEAENAVSGGVYKVIADSYKNDLSETTSDAS